MSMNSTSASTSSTAGATSSVAASSSSAGASLSAISSTTVSTTTTTAVAAIAQQQRRPKDQSERESKDSRDFDAVRGEKEIKQAELARFQKEQELKAAQKGVKGKFEYPRFVKPFFVEGQHPVQHRRFVKSTTGFPFADQMRSMRDYCLKFQGSNSLFNHHLLGLFRCGNVKKFFNQPKSPITRAVNMTPEILLRGVERISSRDEPITMGKPTNLKSINFKVTAVTAEDTGQSRLHVECMNAQTMRSRLPCDLVFVTDEGKSGLPPLFYRIIEQLNSQDRIACLYTCGDSSTCLFPFTQATKEKLEHVKDLIRRIYARTAKEIELQDIVQGIIASFEKLDAIDQGEPRAHIVVWWVEGESFSQEWLMPKGSNRSPTTPVFYCYPGGPGSANKPAGFKGITRRDFSDLRLLGGCPLMAPNRSNVNLGRLTQQSYPYAGNITSSHIDIQGKGVRILDISCGGNASLEQTLGANNFTVSGVGTGRSFRSDRSLSFDLDLVGTPTSLSLFMEATDSGGTTFLKWEPTIQATLTASPFKTYLEGIVRILFEDKSNDYRNKAKALELLTDEIPARHLRLLNSLAQIQHYIECYYTVLKENGSSLTQENMKTLEINLKKAIGEAIIWDYDWEQLPAHVQIAGLFAEELEREEMLWKGTPKSLEQRLRLGPLCPQIERALASCGFNRNIQKIIIRLMGDSLINSRYAAIEGVRNGLLCSGMAACASESYKEMEVKMERDRKTGQEQRIERQVDKVHLSLESIRFNSYTLRLTLDQLEQQDKWPEVVRAYAKEFRTNYDPHTLPDDSSTIKA